MSKQPVTAVHVRRTIAAPPQRVYRAWLDPQLMSRWFAPASFTVRRVEVDERVGGRLRVWHIDSAGNDVGGAEAEIVELIPGERIVLHWQFVGPDRMTDPAMTTLLTVTFTPTPSGTRLDLTHDRLDNLREQFPYIAEQVRPGWESALDALVVVGW